ncbi:HNH endonuclease signature motif containing protein [Naumannella halotolerans]|uniref:HNH endonuclease signature motif containing protein n=1 Tax=Naumannella halotolerans TaxID=993414 RepID=UPI00105E516F|nr:HNH endonuclease signature motif containing protein [Naumannella halotolerans]
MTVRPVIDLNQPAVTDSYVPTARIREQVRLTHPTCIFPWCSRPSAKCDLDHIVVFNAGGPTITDNLAPLCRRHHRLKTFHGWRYRRTGSTDFEWVSPSGEIFRRHGPLSFPAGTDPITPAIGSTPLPTIPGATSLPPPRRRRRPDRPPAADPEPPRF